MKSLVLAVDKGYYAHCSKVHQQQLTHTRLENTSLFSSWHKIMMDTMEDMCRAMRKFEKQH